MIVRMTLSQQLQRFLARLRQTDLVSGMHELACEHAPIRFMIIDDEYATAESMQLDRARLRGSCGRLERQREPERRAFAELAFDTDSAAHHLDETSHDRQSQAGAAEVTRRRRIGLHERLEQRLERFRRDTDAGVADLKFREHLAVALPD